MQTDDTADLVLYEYRAYKPSCVRWRSKGPMLESAFVAFRSREMCGIEIRPDAREYCALAKRPVMSIDYVGRGILCECAVSPPVSGCPCSRGNRIIGDSGGAICTSMNVAATTTYTHEGVDSFNRIVVPGWRYGCEKRSGIVGNTYTWEWRAGTLRWLFTRHEMIKDCL